MLLDKNGQLNRMKVELMTFVIQLGVKSVVVTYHNDKSRQFAWSSNLLAFSIFSSDG